jgi:hypothetical protein
MSETKMSKEEETTLLKKELEQYKSEKEQIKRIIGQIGGNNSSKHDIAINVIFIASIAALFLVDILRHVFGFNIPLTTTISIELGVLLVSLKIIWMMHKQIKVEHFQFWILNSIEFRLNDVSKRMSKIEKMLKETFKNKD